MGPTTDNTIREHRTRAEEQSTLCGTRLQVQINENASLMGKGPACEVRTPFLTCAFGRLICATDNQSRAADFRVSAHTLSHLLSLVSNPTSFRLRDILL